MAGAGRLLLTQGDFWKPAASKYLKAKKFPKLQQKKQVQKQNFMGNSQYLHAVITHLCLGKGSMGWNLLAPTSGFCLSLGKMFKLQVTLSAKSRFTGAPKHQVFWYYGHIKDSISQLPLYQHTLSDVFTQYLHKLSCQCYRTNTRQCRGLWLSPGSW